MLKLEVLFMSVEEKEVLNGFIACYADMYALWFNRSFQKHFFIEFHKDRAYLESVGRPSPGVEIKVFSDQGKEVPEGEEGELCVKGDHVCHSYWNTTEAIFRNDFNGIYFKKPEIGDISVMDMYI